MTADKKPAKPKAKRLSNEEIWQRVLRKAVERGIVPAWLQAEGQLPPAQEKNND